MGDYNMGLFGRGKEKEIINDGSKVYNLKSNGKYEVVLKDNTISITSKGALNAINKGLVGTKKICLDNVTAVQYKEPGLTTGYLQIVLMGSQEVKGGVFKSVKDENTILFNKKEKNEILEIKDYIENYIYGKNKKQDNIQNISVADELLKFKQLLDMGAITQEEFDAKKNEIISIK